ncbi:hypothetical protein [Blastococcus sp. SYSU DS0533]
MRLVALPYLQAETGPECGEWIIEAGGSRRPIPPLLKGWDYSTALGLECIVRVPRSQLLSECGLAEDAEIALAVLWSSSSTNLRRLGAKIPVADDRAIKALFEIPPGIAGGRLSIERLLVLTSAGTSRNPLAARRPGSVLWRESPAEQAVCVLEGDASRFPTDVIDFEQSGLGESGGVWWLHHDLSDLDANPMACLRIRINSSHPAGAKLVEGAPESEEARSVLYWDVHRSLVHAALDSDEFVDNWGNFRLGSLGYTLEQLCRRLWPYEDARALRAARASNRPKFEAAMQARIGLFSGTEE